MKRLSSIFKQPKPFLISFGSLFLFLFIFFSFLVKKKVFQQFDFDMTVKLQDNLSSHLRLTDYFCSLSFIGSFEIMVSVLLITLIIKRKWIGLFITLFLFVSAHLAELIGKTFLKHPQPHHFFLQCHNFLFPTNTLNPGFSYPSGHSLRVVFISTLLFAFIIYQKKLPLFIKIIFITPVAIFTVAMLVSRISLGEHWTTDVIGGALLGIGMSFFSLLFLL